MTFRWYNPLTWRMFGYTDPDSGDFVEVDMVVGAKRTKAGVTVTAQKALAVPMVWSCVKILSEATSGLPLKLYEDSGDRRQLVDRRDRQQRLLRKPNPYITRLNFLKFVVANLALRGNAYAIIERNDAGEWIGTVPLVTDETRPITDEPDVDLIYETSIGGVRTLVSPENMLHFKLFTADGVVGMSPVEHLAETMGLALAAQDWAARFMRKGGVSGGYVIYEQFLTKEQQAQVMEKFPDIRKEDANSLGSWGVLQGNPKIVPAGLSQKDAQFIETQQFQEEAIAGIWGVPLWLANRASKTSIMGSNLEQQLRGFTTFGLDPYLKAIQDEFNDKIWGDTDRFIEFTAEGLLQADSTGRSSYYQSALGGSGGTGWMSVNEVRRLENMEPLPGDEYDRVTRWEMGNANES